MSGVRCELEGGPFDGDSGLWPSREPRLWAFPCRDPGNCSVKGSIHWTDDPIVATQLRAEAYDFDRVQEKEIRDGEHARVRFYVYADLAPGGGSFDEERELVPAGGFPIESGRIEPARLA